MKQSWYRQSKPARGIVPISRFVSNTVFALKNGGYGCLFGVNGMDDEGLTDAEVTDAIARIYGALQGMPEAGRLYQYVRIRRGYELPRKDRYPNATVEAFVQDRTEFLDRTAHFHQIELFWCLTIEPARGRTIRLKPEDHAARTERTIAQLEKSAEILTSQLGSLLGMRLLPKGEVMSFFRYLLNLEEWSVHGGLASDDALDRQIANSSIVWHDDHLRVGKQYVQMFTLTDGPAASRPNLFGPLQALDANMILCASWAPAPRRDVQKRIGQIEGFIGFFRHKFLTLAANLHQPENLGKAVGAKAAEKGTGKLADVLDGIDNEGHHYGRYSFSILLHARERDDLRDTAPLIHRALVEAQAPYVEETLGNLAAYYALLPGNSSGDAASNFNVRQFWLRGDLRSRAIGTREPRSQLCAVADGTGHSLRAARESRA